jgi:hypothetical protein
MLLNFTRFILIFLDCFLFCFISFINVFLTIKNDLQYVWVSSTYANILKYHIQGMPTNITVIQASSTQKPEMP